MSRPPPTASPETFYEVARSVSARLSSEGIPHALVGGLAVAAHGWERATSDVDFIVPRDALTRMTNRPDVIPLTELVDGRARGLHRDPSGTPRAAA